MNDDTVTEEKHTVAAESWETTFNCKVLIFTGVIKIMLYQKSNVLLFLLVYRMHTGH